MPHIQIARQLGWRLILCCSMALGMMAPSHADGANRVLIDDFQDGKADGWRYVSDQVMGGVSDGSMQMGQDGDTGFARLSGTVSTANNGGFIQFRRTLAQPFEDGSTGLTLRVRGNGERYYIHLRPTSANRPWHYFAASFDTDGTWQDITLSWSSFSAQGGLQAEFSPAEITSIGVVAYGADYEAQLDVAQIAVE